MKKKLKTCAVIVTYNPDKSLLEKIFVRIGCQTDQIIVVDNASGCDIGTWIKSAFCGIKFIKAGENLGLAKAQNMGISWALSKKFSHIVFLDQDSLPEKDMVFHLIDAYESLISKGIKTAATGPLLIDSRTGCKFPFVKFKILNVEKVYCGKNNNMKYPETDFLISSGMMIPAQVFKDVGIMDEDFFIDNIDLDWCFRAKSLGYRLFGVCEANLFHTLGDRVFKLPVGRSVRIYFHGPLRQYYIMRNRILLAKKPYSPVAWRIQDFFRIIFKTLILLFTVSPKKGYALMILRGIKDGFFGKSGKYGS